jgi:hypothetical protein
MRRQSDVSARPARSQIPEAIERAMMNFYPPKKEDNAETAPAGRGQQHPKKTMDATTDTAQTQSTASTRLGNFPTP